MPSKLILFELHSNVGVTLFEVQTAERALKFCFTWLGADPDMTLQGLEARQASLSKHTLGRLIKDLRTKLEIESTFEDLLTNFVNNRNLFAHDLLSVDGFDIMTEDGVASGIDFLRLLAQQAREVTSTFMGLNAVFAKSRDATDTDLFTLPITVEALNEMKALLRVTIK